MSTPNEQRTALLNEAIAIFTIFLESGGHREYVGHLDSRLDPYLEALVTAASAPLAGQDALAALGSEAARFLVNCTCQTDEEYNALGQAIRNAKTLASASRAGGAVEEAIGRLEAEARRAQLYANVSVYDLRLVINALRAATKPKANEGMEREDSNP